MSLSISEREQFLAEPNIGVLSVIERPDRAPLTIPIWYHYTPGGDVWVNTPPDSRKARAIRSAGRFSLMVQRTAPTVRYVSVEGPVIRVEPGSYELSRQMAVRYMQPEKVADFVEYERTQLGEHVGIHMRPEHWLSADLGPSQPCRRASRVCPSARIRAVHPDDAVTSAAVKTGVASGHCGPGRGADQVLR